MAKKKSSKTKIFRTTRAMDNFLEKADLGDLFAKYGKQEAPVIRKISLDLPEAM